MQISRSRALWKNMKKCWQLYLILLLPMATLILLSYVPMYGVQIAFRDFTPTEGITGSQWVGLQHFVRFFQSSDFVTILVNTLRLAALSLLTGPPLSIAFALMLNTVRREWMKKTIQTITYAPNFISMVVLVGMINMMLSPVSGIYGSIYSLFHGGEIAADAITGLESTFVPIYIISGIWQTLGFNSIIYLAALSSVDMELHEAAIIDGATRFKRIFYIDLPAIAPTISINVILAFGNIMNVGFEKVYLMQSQLNLPVSEVISTYIYKYGLLGGLSGFSYGAAVGLFNSVINCVMLLAVNFLSSKISRDSTSLF